MSVSRMIDEARRGMGTMQVFRLVLAIICMVVLAALLWRFGLPPRLDGRAGLLSFVFLMGATSAAAFVFRQWPARYGRLAGLVRRWEPNRRLRFTREGRFLVGITVAVGAAAMNTGNNFLYLVMGMLMAMIVVSGVLSEWVLRGVDVRLEPGGERLAGQPGLVAFHVRNTKRHLASMALEVAPLVAPPGPDGQAPHVQLPGKLLLRLAPGVRQRLVVRTDLPQRGVWRVLGFEVATAYPFGFFRKWTHQVPTAIEPQDLLVAPAPAKVAHHLVRMRMLVGESVGGRPGGSDEYHSLRMHTAGEDVRKVAWKRSARAGRLMVREDEDPRGRMVTLVIPGGVAFPDALAQAAYEHAHRVAAGLMLALLDRGDPVGVVAGAHAVAPSVAADQRGCLLAALARANQREPLADLPAASRLGAVVVLDVPGLLPARLGAHVRLPLATAELGRKAA